MIMFSGLTSSDSEALRLRQSQGILRVKDGLLFGRYQVMVTNEIKRTLAMLREEQALRLKTIEAEVIEGVIAYEPLETLDLPIKKADTIKVVKERVGQLIDD